MFFPLELGIRISPGCWTMLLFCSPGSGGKSNETDVSGSTCIASGHTLAFLGEVGGSLMSYSDTKYHTVV